jgi:leucyl aminopeptidase (aminopeptidase T)
MTVQRRISNIQRAGLKTSIRATWTLEIQRWIWDIPTHLSESRGTQMGKTKRELGAYKLVTTNGRVRPGENVVIVADDNLLALAHLVADAAEDSGASVVTCIMPQRSQDGQEPPAPVAAAMAEADVIFSPVSVSITHTRAVRSALDRGARAILMTAYTDQIITSAGLLETNFEEQADLCRRFGAALEEGDKVRLTSPRGTNLSFSIVDRRVNVLTNIPEPGELAPVPDIEVNVVPLEGSANGRLIADASVPYLGIGVLDEPIICDVEDGYIVSMTGGNQAALLRDALEIHEDRNCFNVAELGIGLNPNAKLTGRMLDDEGVLGTIHIGIGTSHALGGNVVAPTHYDLLMWNPTIEIDGRVVQRGAEVLV